VSSNNTRSIFVLCIIIEVFLWVHNSCKLISYVHCNPNFFVLLDYQVGKDVAQCLNEALVRNGLNLQVNALVCCYTIVGISVMKRSPH
jgi:hypothetical protein